MAVGQDKGPMPLYVHTVQRVLREMRLVQQERRVPFDYSDFKQKILNAGLLPAQLEPLNQRLDTLESFMPSQQTNPISSKSDTKPKPQSPGSSWMLEVSSFYWILDQAVADKTSHRNWQSSISLVHVSLQIPLAPSSTFASEFSWHRTHELVE